MADDMERTASERDPWIGRLSEYLDGDLGAAEHQRLEAHLTSCARCATTLAELRAVVARARRLENAPPATDLWPAIAARLEPRSRAAGATAEPARAPLAIPAWWARRFDLGLPQLAAAGVLLIALSAGAVWLAMQAVAPRASSRGPIAAGPAAPVGSASEPATGSGAGIPVAGTGVAAAPAMTALANPRYDAAVAELERALAEGRGRLDPRTLRVVEENLRIIDRALEEARQAVAADPGNTWLRSHLATTMQRKVDLLRSATSLVSAQG